MTESEQDLANRLDRAWDAALGHAVAGDIDQGFADAVARLHARDDAPQPNPRFLARLRADLLASPVPRPARVRGRSRHLGIVFPTPVPIPRRAVIRLAIAAIAAIVLLAALSGGGRWLAGSSRAPVVASALASSVPPRVTFTATTIGAPRGEGDLLEGTHIERSLRLLAATVVTRP